MIDIDEAEKQFSDDLETMRVEFSDKLNAAIEKFLKLKFGGSLGKRLARDSKVIIKLEVEMKDG